MPELSIHDVARVTGGQVFGDGDRRVRGVAPLDEAGPEHLSFVANPKYFAYIHASRAGALLVPEGAEVALPEGAAGVRVADAHVALSRVLPLLHPERPLPAGVHPTAVLGRDVQVGEGAGVGPYAVIGDGSRLGAGCRVGAHVSVGAGCSVGAGAVLHPHATLYDATVVGDRAIVHSGARLGADGFGFVFEGGEHRKVPQVGRCVVEDDVEIGANTTVDRGSIGDTVVGRGSKLDNLVHVGHNCRLGRGVIVVAQVGISGSTRVGDFAVLGGQAGIGGHLAIGAGARVGAQAGVTADVPAGATVSGYPARPHREAMRAQAAVFRLPALLKRIARIERALFGGAAGDG